MQYPQHLTTNDHDCHAYKTQTRTIDKAIAELFIASFFDQLEEWWDYHLIET